MANSALLLPSENGRPPKFYDHLTGIQTIRGGQQVGEGFFSSVFNSFYNIIYHFWGLLLAIFGVLTLLSEYGTTTGPLEMLLKAIMKFLSDPDVPVVFKSVASALAWLLGYLIKYKYMVAYSAILFVPAIVKPSTRNILFSGLLVFLAFLHYITILQVLLLALLFYLFVMLRTPAHKFFILFLVIMVFGAGFTDRGPVVDRLNKLVSPDLSRPLSFKPQVVDVNAAAQGTSRVKRHDDLLADEMLSLSRTVKQIQKDFKDLQRLVLKEFVVTTTPFTPTPAEIKTK
ncbi:hypothetical protein [Xingshan nematode virus 1]|uniref:hypothetical protein n=1 Tax=Xingshan nematode virus 1 TaxID=1923760 RepID=UPI0009096665|nr:hypothetical protein [Xingshan nematode virus 1]APG77853.1 hypothetical protein [Xingshan nematode virus 1]